MATREVYFEIRFIFLTEIYVKSGVCIKENTSKFRMNWNPTKMLNFVIAYKIYHKKREKI